MSARYKISLSVSIAITILFVLPWLSLLEQSNAIKQSEVVDTIRGRLSVMAISTFLSSLLFFYLNFFWQKNRQVSSARRWRWINAVGINILLVIVLSFLLTWLMIGMFEIALVRAFFIVSIFRILAISLVSLLVVYAYEVSERSKSDRIKLLNLNHEIARAELAMLRNQLSPHFLFNNLNTLTGVIRKSPSEGIRFVNHLSETFRYVLDNRADELTTLQEELKFLESHLYMMRMRFGDGLNVNMQVTSQDLLKRLPQHALQLLVENAIKHNIVSTKRPLVVHIQSSGNELRVRNNRQTKRTALPGFGIGLASLRKRYELLGYDSVTVTMTDKTFEVALILL